MRLIHLTLPHSHPLSPHFDLILPTDRPHVRRSAPFTPPLIAGHSNPIVLTGHAVITDWESSNRRSIPALVSLPDRSSLARLWKTRWALAEQNRHSDIEIALAFHRCVLDCSVKPAEAFSWIPEHLRTHGPDELLRVGALPRSFLIRLHTSSLDWSTVSRLADFYPSDRRSLFSVCCLFSQASSSQFRMIVDVLQELAIIGNTTIRDYLRDPVWRKNVAERTRKQRAQLLTTHLNRLRNPLQTRFQEKINDMIADVALPPGARLLTPPGGEGCTIDLNMRLTSINELDEYAEALRNSRQAIERLLTFLRDE